MARNGLAARADVAFARDHRIPVGGVRVAVGEAPGDASVAAHDDRGQAGQAEAGDVDLAARRMRVGIAQAHAEPDARRAQSQVHVVGDDGTAIGRQCAGDRPVVAARRALVGQALVGIRLRHRQRAQVHLAGVRQRGVAARLAIEGRVPFGAIVREQIVETLRHVPADLPQAQLAHVLRILQVEIHRIARQRRIQHVPATRLLSQQQVGPRPGAQVAETGVDAVGIGLQLGHAVARERVEVGRHARADPVYAPVLVQADGDGAEQLGQLARRTAAHQVHFEIAFLRVHVAQCTDGIGFAGRIDGDHAQGVALHADGRRQSRQVRLALQLRQASAQHPPCDQEHQYDQGQQQQRDAPGPLQHCGS